MNRTSIETISGKFLDFANPTAKMLTVESIAWGISRQPRFAGQTLGELPYSVAQHSVYVAYLVEQAMIYGSRLNVWLRTHTESTGLQNLLNDRLALENTIKNGALLALFHDGSEGFLCDLPTPAKRLSGLGPEYSKIEKPLMSAVYDLVGLNQERVPIVISELVHWADLYALAVEVYHLIPSRGNSAEWGHLPETNLVDVLEWPAPLPAVDAFSLFVNAYDTITRT